MPVSEMLEKLNGNQKKLGNNNVNWEFPEILTAKITKAKKNRHVFSLESGPGSEL